MICASATVFNATVFNSGERKTAHPGIRSLRHFAVCTGLAVALAVTLAIAGCASGGSKSGGRNGGGSASSGEGEEKTVLLSRRGETSIQVTESELDGNQIVRVRTTFRGEENIIIINIDQPVYEVEIPLSLEQVLPQSASAAARGPEGQFQDLLIAQWLQKAQQSMMDGNYNGALRQVDTVLQVNPNHIQAHSMKGSVYYALGNYDLANDEWEMVLSLDPSNKEVQEFREFLKNRASGAPPRMPGAAQGGGASPAPAAPGAPPKGANQ